MQNSMNLPSSEMLNSTAVVPASRKPISVRKADFQDAKFRNGCAFFEQTEFNGDTNFSSTLFNESVDFREAEFKGKANFQTTKFNNQDAFFSDVKFIGGDVDFQNAEFCWNAHFQNTKFRWSAIFSEAKFKKSAHFEQAKFKWNTYFRNTKFSNGEVNFKKLSSKVKLISRLQVTTELVNAFHGEVDFSGAEFLDEANFNNRNFRQETSFRNCTFQKAPVFMTASFTRKRISRTPSFWTRPHTVRPGHTEH